MSDAVFTPEQEGRIREIWAEEQAAVDARLAEMIRVSGIGRCLDPVGSVFITDMAAAKAGVPALGGPAARIEGRADD